MPYCCILFILQISVWTKYIFQRFPKTWFLLFIHFRFVQLQLAQLQYVHNRCTLNGIFRAVLTPEDVTLRQVVTLCSHNACNDCNYQ